jgi:hypothetical protein
MPNHLGTQEPRLVPINLAHVNERNAFALRVDLQVLHLKCYQLSPPCHGGIRHGE